MMAPDLIDKLRFHTPTDKERATQIIAERMGTNPDTDIRPGLLVQLAFAAADFAFQQWVLQTGRRRPLARYVTEALEPVKSPHWKRKKTS
jgi:MftR C-terminal domain